MTFKWLRQTLILVIFFSTCSATAAEYIKNPTRGAFGLKVGVISRSEINGDFFASTELGSTLQVFANHPLGRDLYISTAFDFYYIEISTFTKYNGLNLVIRSDQVMLEGSVGLKRFYKIKRSGISIVPGFSMGYGRLTEIGDLKLTNYLIVKGVVETHFPINRHKAWIGELGVIYAPSGGNKDIDVTFGPIYMLRIGVVFR